MPIYDYLCDCGKAHNDKYFNISDCPESIPCDCGGSARKIITWSGHFTGNQDATWLKSVRAVVSKDPNKRHCREFLKDPTRSNYRNWMKGEGLRPLERSEKTDPPKTDLKELKKATLNKFVERNRLSVGGL